MQKDKTPAFHLLVIDGNQSENKKQRQNKWIPAFAGMTNKTAPPCKDRSRPVGRPRGGIVPTDSPPRLVSFTNSRNQGFFNNPEKGAIASFLVRQPLLPQSGLTPHASAFAQTARLLLLPLKGGVIFLPYRSVLTLKGESNIGQAQGPVPTGFAMDL